MIKTYKEFVFEKTNIDYTKKINFLLAGKKIEGLTGTNNKRIYGDINEKCLKNLLCECCTISRCRFKKC